MLSSLSTVITRRREPGNSSSFRVLALAGKDTLAPPRAVAKILSLPPGLNFQAGIPVGLAPCPLGFPFLQLYFRLKQLALSCLKRMLTCGFFICTLASCREFKFVV